MPGLAHVTNARPITDKSGTNKPIKPNILLTFVLDTFPLCTILSLKTLDNMFNIALAIYGMADIRPFFMKIEITGIFIHQRKH